MLQDTAPPQSPTAVVRCDTCGQIIGVYEPMILVSPAGDVIETSVAALGAVSPDGLRHHPACYAW